ncbi:MAG: penicillin-binding protein 2 [Candidatus Omnitrophota bacterium]|nr:penicillin-binding protein 2 [Candidatus Omnitrophota bacterium]
MFRLRIIKLAGVFIFIFLIAALFNLQVIGARKYRRQSDKNCIRLLPHSGLRGKILDRNNNVITDSRLSYDVVIFPQNKPAFNKVLTNISNILGTKLKGIKNTAKSERIASSTPVTFLKNIDLKEAIALEQIRLQNPGLVVLPVPLRHYPHQRLACHVIGYLSEIDHWRLRKLEDYGYRQKDIVGFGGVEERYDYYLRQEEGGLSFEVDHRGKLTRVLGFKQPVNGKDIQLTLDLRLQKIAEDAFLDKKGAVVIMDPYTGEILAMASFPNFSLSAFVDKSLDSIPNFFNDPDAPLINRAISAAYPAGSIFKIIVAAAALETKKINPSTTFNCQGSTQVGKKQFNCWSTHNQQSLHSAIAHSCNVYFYKTGLLLGAQLIYNYGLKFGLSKVIPFELFYETAGFLPSPLWKKADMFKRWYDGDTANLSIGQGDVLVTPLQMARMMAVFANKGYLVRPYITKAINGGDIGASQRRARHLFFKENTLNEIRQGLREVVSDSEGTANILSGLLVSVAGKTGTAQAPPGASHSWFVGFFPFKEPRYVICVFLERGGPGYYACLVTKQIIEKMLEQGII